MNSLKTTNDTVGTTTDTKSAQCRDIDDVFVIVDKNNQPANNKAAQSLGTSLNQHPLKHNSRPYRSGTTKLFLPARNLPKKTIQLILSFGCLICALSFLIVLTMFAFGTS